MEPHKTMKTHKNLTNSLPSISPKIIEPAELHKTMKNPNSHPSLCSLSPQNLKPQKPKNHPILYLSKFFEPTELPKTMKTPKLQKISLPSNVL